MNVAANKIVFVVLELNGADELVVVGTDAAMYGEKCEKKWRII